MIRSEGAWLRISLAALLSFSILGMMFWALFQIDVPFARFLRSLHMGWLERMGDLGTRLGSGAALIAISGGLLLGGWLWKQPHVRTAGLKALLAHGLAAIVVQALKHGIGRPRPRLMHADNGLPWRPSLESGLDSFPSGHTTASFAVAAVLAKSFPKIAWLSYTLAGFVAISRAIRGSHFPSDVIAGICLGTIVGMSVVYPIREWKRSLLAMTARFLPSLILVFSLLWLSTHFPRHSMADPMMVTGIAVLAIGVAMRIFRVIGRAFTMNAAVAVIHANRIIVVGVALTTGLWLITVVVGMLSVIQWLLYPEASTPSVVLEAESPFPPTRWTVLEELSVMIGLTLAVVTIQHLKGVLPIV